MIPEKIIENLDYINRWRRDSTGQLEQPKPSLVGETIDEAIKLLKVDREDLLNEFMNYLNEQTPAYRVRDIDKQLAVKAFLKTKI